MVVTASVNSFSPDKKETKRYPNCCMNKKTKEDIIEKKTDSHLDICSLKKRKKHKLSAMEKLINSNKDDPKPILSDSLNSFSFGFNRKKFLINKFKNPLLRIPLQPMSIELKIAIDKNSVLICTSLSSNLNSGERGIENRIIDYKIN